MSAVAAHITSEVSEVRDGEKPRVWYRSERIHREDGLWFIQTREGIEVGPFNCRFDAEVESEILVRHLKDAPADRTQQIITNILEKVLYGEPSLNTAAFTSYLVEVGGAELLRR